MNDWPQDSYSFDLNRSGGVHGMSELGDTTLRMSVAFCTLSAPGNKAINKQRLRHGTGSPLLK